VPMGIRNPRLSFRQRGRRATDAAVPARSPGHPLLQLQRTLGNQTVQQVLRADSFQTSTASARHADAYEREADHVPEHVVASMPQIGVQGRCACGGTPGPGGECATCRAKRLALQRTSTDISAPGTIPAGVSDVLRSPGQPLDSSSRTLFESRLGYDFSEVRIHADARAVDSARAMNVYAYTVGRDVVFAAGQYDPGTALGRRLLAHELTHVVQQRTIIGGIVAPIFQRQKSPFGKVKTFETVDYRAEDLVDAALVQSKLLWPYVGSKVEAGIRIKGGVIFLPQKNFEEAYVAHAHRSGEAVEEAKNVRGYYDPQGDKIVLATPATLEAMLHEAIHKFADRSFRLVFASGLNEGVTQFFTNTVLQEFGLQRGRAYPKEVVAAEALADAVGLEDLGLGYFLGPGNHVLDALKTKVPGLDMGRFLHAIREREVDWQRVAEMIQGDGTQGPKQK